MIHQSKNHFKSDIIASKMNSIVNNLDLKSPTLSISDNKYSIGKFKSLEIRNGFIVR